MSDDGTTEAASSGINWWLIGLIAAGLGAAVLLAFLLFSGDDSSDSSDTTLATSTTAETTTTTLPPETTTTVAETTTTTLPPETTTTVVETTTTPVPPVLELEFSIRDIADGGTIPVEFTCDGANTPPIVNIEAIPDGTAQMAFIVDDPDAPTPDPFAHWLVYNISAGTSQITDGDPAFTYGTNDFGENRWLGPCPPPGDGPHRYEFTLYALTSPEPLPQGLDARALSDAIEQSIAAEAEVTATYERPAS
jgi:Raf kinase inhibitor-like YbhB/YbcL family protein